jgi:hypothetical protein
MKLFTKEQREQLIKNGLPENRDKDHYPAAKLFLPGSNCTWLLTELDYEEPSIAFGLCDLGLGFPELGSVSLDELQELSHPYLFTKVERDMYFKGLFPISVYAETARIIGYITEEHAMLAAHAPEGLKPKW